MLRVRVELVDVPGALAGLTTAVAALELARAIVTLEEQDLGSALAGVAYADAGALVPVDQAERYPLALRALADGVPATGPAGPQAAPLPVESGWVLWVAPQLPDPLQLAVVGRRMDVRFAATEAARLRALVTLLEQVRRVRT